MLSHVEFERQQILKSEGVEKTRGYSNSPPNINPTDEANAPLIYAAISTKCSDDGHIRPNLPFCL
jgi:hypothetical protein